MHSSRMRTARSLTVSRRIPCMPPGCHTCPQLPCMPPGCHACPPAATHAPPGCHACPQLPRTPPGCHACSPAAMHTPWLPHMPPSCHTWPSPLAAMHNPPGCHARPPCGQTDTCKNITFANFVWRAVISACLAFENGHGCKLIQLIHLQINYEPPVKLLRSIYFVIVLKYHV